MSRKPDALRKTEKIEIRVTKDQKRALDDAAVTLGLTTSSRLLMLGLQGLTVGARR